MLRRHWVGIYSRLRKVAGGCDHERDQVLLVMREEGATCT